MAGVGGGGSQTTPLLKVRYAFAVWKTKKSEFIKKACKLLVPCARTSFHAAGLPARDVGEGHYGRGRWGGGEEAEGAWSRLVWEGVKSARSKRAPPFPLRPSFLWVG